MDAQSGTRRVGTADRSPGWSRALLVWMLIMLAETLHGILREVFIAPVIGGLRARQLGVLIGSLLVLLITRLCWRLLRSHSVRQLLVIGGAWVLLTLTFEISLGRAMNLSWERILSDYNPARGGFMLLGLAVMFAAPWLTARWVGRAH